MFKKLMEKKLIYFWVILFCLVGVLAQDDDWDSYSDDGGNDSGSVGKGSTDSLDNDGGNSRSSDISESSSGDKGRYANYTSNFYLAMGVLGIGAAIIIFFIYLFLKTPQNDWEK